MNTNLKKNIRDAEKMAVYMQYFYR